jgi:hypothetical protein
MEKYFLPYKLALELKELGFDEPCFGFYIETKELIPASYSQEGTVYPSNSDLLISEWVSAPLYSQVIDFFEKEHNIFIGRTCYDDGKTPKRWVYHVDSYYVQEQSYDGAIRYAIDKIKNTQL